jgi:hypothetical protein
MKKTGLIILCVISMLSMFAQNDISIFKSDSSVLGVQISAIDSMKLENSDLKLYISDKSVTSFPVSSVDSIKFGNYFPVVKTVEASAVTQTYAKVGLVIKSNGSSPITEKGVCWCKSGTPTIDSSKVELTSALDSATVYMTGLTGGTSYNVRAYAKNGSGIAYGQLISVSTLEYSLPVVETTSVTYAGNLQALCIGKVLSNGGFGVLLSRGFCWSASENPTVDDNKVAYGVTNGSYQTNVKLPSLNTKYYVRAYATNQLGTSYGVVMSVKPTAGNVTYNLAQSSNPTAQEKEYYRLIKIAMDSACYYYNLYTTFSANIYVYYNSGIPTAQASYRGSIGFGSGTTYMHVCTAMHEMAHYMGSGTTTVWQNLTVNGVYTGAAATKMLKTLTGDQNAVLHGDDMHFWPYGLNYRSEVSSAEDYVRHAKIVEAMKTDCGW